MRFAQDKQLVFIYTPRKLLNCLLVKYGGDFFNRNGRNSLNERSSVGFQISLLFCQFKLFHILILAYIKFSRNSGQFLRYRSKRASAKNFAEAQAFKRGKPSRDQESLLPGSRQPDDVMAVDVVPVADEQTLGNEEADVDAVTDRDASARAHILLLEQTLPSVEEVSNDRIDHDICFRDLIDLGIEEILLLLPRLRLGIGNRRFADEVPFERTGRITHLVVVIPVLLVEHAMLGRKLHARGLRPHADDRGRDIGDEDVAILALGEHFLGERNLGHVGELPFREGDAKVLLGFLDAEEVLAHDFAGFRLRDRGFVAVVVTQSCHAWRNALIGIDPLDDNIGAVAECVHQGVECSVSLTRRDFCPFHNCFPFAVGSSAFCFGAAGYRTYDSEITSCLS